jgi:predicted AAA+ superfamily ATPase
MQRHISTELLKWKTRSGRKPLILTGVRQCGKTYLLNEFGQEQYGDVAYFNFESNPALAERFEQDLNPQRLIAELGVFNRRAIKPETTLLFFDEIQFCHNALTALKYFQEQAPQYHIVCAGSLLGIALSQPSSFPVGKVEFLALRPMNFYEFLLAHNETPLLEYLEQAGQAAIPKLLADTLISHLKAYFITGGMPEVVSQWIQSKDIAEIERIQDAILNAYELDFAKHAPPKDFPKLSLIWHRIPDQLAKENSKFVFGQVKPGARAKDLEDALQWLVRAGMVHKVCKITKPHIPLSAYADQNYFKLFLADIGLLRRLAKLPASAIYDESPLFTEFKGALTENYVLLELLNILAEAPFYWKSENTAEVDFVALLNDGIVPIEVKAATNVKARSLTVYRQKYQPKISIRTSLRNLKEDDGLWNIPLYMLWNLGRLL